MPTKLNRQYFSIGAEQYHPYTITSDFVATLQKSSMKDVIHEHQPNSFYFNTIDETQLINNRNVQT